MKETAANLLAQSRADKGLSKEAAARLLGISTRHYYNLESGETTHPNRTLRLRIAREFGVDFPIVDRTDRSAA